MGSACLCWGPGKRRTKISRILWMIIDNAPKWEKKEKRKNTQQYKVVIYRPRNKCQNNQLKRGLLSGEG